MLRSILLATTLAWALPALAADAPKPHDAPKSQPDMKADAKSSDGSVTIGGKPVAYQAVAGTLVVHPKGWDDAAKPEKDDKDADAKDADDHNPTAEASMFYVAYFAHGAPAEGRPITFFFNGGPGSSTVWLHMGAFGPRRVVTLDDSHTPAAPYQLVDNGQSLLDATDEVFIDAPGTGFSRVSGKDKEKAFYGIDQDAHAFAEFITAFLSKYGRWNSPKYIFGESYGTTRSAVLSNLLQSDYATDLNGVILLSQILSFDDSADLPELNPGVDMAYPLALPTYAATACYHHKLGPNPPANLPAFLGEVEHFAMNDYVLALAAGAALDPAKRDAIAGKLHDYTGLPVAYIKKANLRISGGEFEKTLQDDTDTTTGRLDTRFSGPTMDPLSKEADYDPQSAAISSAYVSTFNDYVRRVLHYGEGKTYKPEIENDHWDFQHQPPGAPEALPISANVMPDIAAALKTNPTLKIMLNAGYYDLATPFYQGIYEMQHLPIPQKLQSNIEFKQYESGHMVYAHQAALQQLHDNVAGFIGRTHR